jgi:solute carrier family 39 (zinc transporter), member 7
VPSCRAHLLLPALFCRADDGFSFRLGIFVGFASFFVMEKTLRVLGGGDDDHSHGHSHSHSAIPEAHASGVSVSSSKSGLKARKSEKEETDNDSEANGQVQVKSGTQPSKLSAYLNLFGDFVHNMYVVLH